MALSALTLGSVTFANQEVPESIAFPKKQGYAKKKRIGGSRNIQTLGIDYGIITWSGIIRTSSSETRSRILDTMLASGSVQRLTYLSNAYDVIVVSYTPNFHSSIKIEYTIEVEVVKDVSGSTSFTIPYTIDQQIASANQNANANLVSIVSNDSTATAMLQPSFVAMNNALDAAGPAASATGTNATAASQSISTALTAAKTYLNSLSSGNITQILASRQYANNLAIISKNFAAGQAPRTVTVTGGSFADLAVAYYQDASLATALQNANGAASSYLPNNVSSTIVLPPLNASTL